MDRGAAIMESHQGDDSGECHRRKAAPVGCCNAFESSTFNRRNTHRNKDRFRIGGSGYGPFENYPTAKQPRRRSAGLNLAGGGASLEFSVARLHMPQRSCVLPPRASAPTAAHPYYLTLTFRAVD